MADSAVGRRHRSDLVHDLGRRKMRLRISHTVHDLREYPGIRLRLSRDRSSLADPLNTALRIGKRPLLLRIGDSRKNYIRKLRGLRHE